jgi:hypothetical protein
VVLPFANAGGDSEQEHFVDGVTESMTTDLSRIHGSFVISRNSAFTYKGKPFDVKQIGRELNVRYLLEGSIQPGGNRMRVNVRFHRGRERPSSLGGAFRLTVGRPVRHAGRYCRAPCERVGYSAYRGRGRGARSERRIPNRWTFVFRAGLGSTKGSTLPIWRGAAAISNTPRLLIRPTSIDGSASRLFT